MHCRGFFSRKFRRCMTVCLGFDVAELDAKFERADGEDVAVFELFLGRWGAVHQQWMFRGESGRKDALSASGNQTVPRGDVRRPHLNIAAGIRADEE